MRNFTAKVESKGVGDLKPIPSQEPYSEASKQLRLNVMVLRN